VEAVTPSEYIATTEVSSATTLDELASLKETGQALSRGAAKPIAANIILLSACMEALPDILTGANPSCSSLRAPDTMF
jgi:uncharacterized protein involved in response to NO